MDQTKRRYQVTIMSAVDELQRSFRSLNNLYFAGQLEDVIITIQTDPKRQAYAWISVAKTWNDKSDNWYHEVNIVAEWLNREPVDVIASLLHEMCHLFNLQRGVQDTSRSGTYHNDRFREVAVTHGLLCERVDKYGWALTKPTEELAEWTKTNVRPGCFRFRKASTWSDGTPKTGVSEGKDGKPKADKKGRSNIRKYVCPRCGLIIRASKNIDGMVMCMKCLRETEAADPASCIFVLAD